MTVIGQIGMPVFPGERPTRNALVVIAMSYLEAMRAAHCAPVISLYHNSIWSWCKRPQIKAESRHFKGIIIVSFRIQRAGAQKPTQQKNVSLP